MVMARWFRRRERLDPFWSISYTDRDFDDCPEPEAAYRTQVLWFQHRSGGAGIPLGASQAMFFRTQDAAERARRRLQADNPHRGGPSWAMACVFHIASGQNLTIPAPRRLDGTPLQAPPEAGPSPLTSLLFRGRTRGGRR